MERNELLKLGAFCLKRLSLKGQKELLRLAENEVPFSDFALAGLGETEKGQEFIAACGGRLSMTDLMDILTCCDQPTIDRIITDDRHKSLFLESAEINGHFVLENNAIYYTLDMDSTLLWFQKVLGWPGVVEARDASGKGLYGLISPHLKASAPGNRSPYMQLMRGQPAESVAGFIKIWGLDKLRQQIIANGWLEMTPVKQEPWGARLFAVTTGDGSELRFYEPDTVGD
ncbi:MAG: hypothetical protein WC370_04525 [Dehalococcoidales bacterium]|jgi:hypothetical protein